MHVPSLEVYMCEYACKFFRLIIINRPRNVQSVFVPAPPTTASAQTPAPPSTGVSEPASSGYAAALAHALEAPDDTRVHLARVPLDTSVVFEQEFGGRSPSLVPASPTPATATVELFVGPQASQAPSTDDEPSALLGMSIRAF